MSPGPKLYVALVDTLDAGQRCAQTAHVLSELWHARGEQCRAWRASTNIVAVVTADRHTLALLAADPTAAEFREPDLGDMRTAVALWPSTDASRRALARCPLVE